MHLIVQSLGFIHDSPSSLVAFSLCALMAPINRVACLGTFPVTHLTSRFSCPSFIGPILPAAAALRRGHMRVFCQRVHVAGKCQRVCIIHDLSVIVRLSGRDSRRRARVRVPAAVRTRCTQVVCMCQRKLLTLSRNGGGTRAYRAGRSCCRSLATCKTGAHLCIWVTCLHKTGAATKTGRLLLSGVYARSPW